MKISTLIAIILMCTSCGDTSGRVLVDEKQNSTTTATTRKLEEPKNFNPNYTHVVYFWFKNPNDMEGRKLFEKSLRTFLEKSEFAQTQFIGIPPVATRDVVDDSYTYNLILSFDSPEDQESYQNELVHKIFIDESSHLWEKVIVYDAMTIK